MLGERCTYAPLRTLASADVIVLSFAPELLQLPKVSMHITERDYLSRHTGPACAEGWRYPQH